MVDNGHKPGEGDYRRILVALFFAGIATFAQLYSAQAVLPQIAQSLRVSPSVAALSVSLCTFGLAASVIPWSAVADRLGRVPVMVAGVCVASGVGLVAPFAESIEVLLAARLIEGVALGAVPAVALAYLSEEIAPRYVAGAAGSYIAGTTVGGLSGRLVSGPVGELLGWHWGMWATSVLCAVAAALFILLIPPARGFHAMRYASSSGQGLAGRLLVNLRSPAQVAIYAQGFLLMGVFVAVYNYVGFHLTGPPYALPGWLVSLLFLAYLSGTVSSPFAGVLASRHGRFLALAGSTAVMGVGVLIMLIPSLAPTIIGLVLFTAGFFGAHTVAAAWAPAVSKPSTRAQASSLYYLGYYGGSSVFGWCLGVVFAARGWNAFLLACVSLIVVAMIIAAVTLRQRG